MRAITWFTDKGTCDSFCHPDVLARRDVSYTVTDPLIFQTDDAQGRYIPINSF